MIDISELIIDPDFCEALTIRRRVGEWVNGRFVANPEEIQTTGVAEPTSGEQLEMLPEGDRVSGMMTFYTTVPAYVARHDHSQSDEIIWHGRTYKAVHEMDWGRHSFYMTMASLVDQGAAPAAGGDPNGCFEA